MPRRLLLCLTWIWASPYTLLGLLLGTLLRGRFHWVDGVIEIEGERVAAFLLRLPVPAMAMTLGHSVLGQTRAALDITREHERVHVRQFSRWGPFMGPAYLLSSAYLWMRGRDAYRDNPFEREAFRIAP